MVEQHEETAADVKPPQADYAEEPEEEEEDVSVESVDDSPEEDAAESNKNAQAGADHASNGIWNPTSVDSTTLSTILPALVASDQQSQIPSQQPSLLQPALLLATQQAQQQQPPPPPEATAAALALALEGNTHGNPALAAAVVQANPLLHNLIPTNLQSLALAPSLNGTPGYPSALIQPFQHQQQQAQQQLPPTQPLVGGHVLTPAVATLAMAVPSTVPLTVQDRPMTPPVYNGVNPSYPGLRVLNNCPPMFCVDNFLTPFECDFLIQVAHDSFGPAPVVGKGAGEVSPSRTSSTCYLAREDVPDVLRKISILTGKPVEHCELPQVGRYFPTQQYLQHFDAFDLSTEDGCRFAANGGQRTITVLIYLNDVLRGGATRFPALNMEVQPRRGMALVFFPATVDGMLDKMALHAALPAVDTKYVSQCWIRQSNYNGQPSKRLPATLGTPFGTDTTSPGVVDIHTLQPAAAAFGVPQQQPPQPQQQQQPPPY